jgi:hypothetical protein
LRDRASEETKNSKSKGEYKGRGRMREGGIKMLLSSHGR